MTCFAKLIKSSRSISWTLQPIGKAALEIFLVKFYFGYLILPNLNNYNLIQKFK